MQTLVAETSGTPGSSILLRRRSVFVKVSPSGRLGRLTSDAEYECSEAATGP
jgi:hypothetical protein